MKRTKKTFVKDLDGTTIMWICNACGFSYFPTSWTGDLCMCERGY